MTNFKVYDSLAKARRQLATAPMQKSGKNKFAKFSYFQLDDILKELIPIMEENKLVTIYDLGGDVSSVKVVSTEDGSEAVFTLRNFDAWATATMGNDKQSSGMQPVQRLGSVQTYVRRYLLIQAFEIVEPDVIDQMEPQQTSSRQQPKQQPKQQNNKPQQTNNNQGEAQRADLQAAATELGDLINKVAADNGVNTADVVAQFGITRNLSPENMRAKVREIKEYFAVL